MCYDIVLVRMWSERERETENSEKVWVSEKSLGQKINRESV